MGEINKWLRVAGYKRASGRWDIQEIAIDIAVISTVCVLAYFIILWS